MNYTGAPLTSRRRPPERLGPIPIDTNISVHSASTAIDGPHTNMSATVLQPNPAFAITDDMMNNCNIALSAAGLSANWQSYVAGESKARDILGPLQAQIRGAELPSEPCSFALDNTHSWPNPPIYCTHQPNWCQTPLALFEFNLQQGIISLWMRIASKLPFWEKGQRLPPLCAKGGQNRPKLDIPVANTSPADQRLDGSTTRTVREYPVQNIVGHVKTGHSMKYDISCLWWQTSRRYHRVT